MSKVFFPKCEQFLALLQQCCVNNSLHCYNSIEINIDMAKEIESQEHEVHAEVKRLLRKYEKFRVSDA